MTTKYREGDIVNHAVGLCPSEGLVHEVRDTPFEFDQSVCVSFGGLPVWVQHTLLRIVRRPIRVGDVLRLRQAPSHAVIVKAIEPDRWRLEGEGFIEFTSAKYFKHDSGTPIEPPSSKTSESGSALVPPSRRAEAPESAPLFTVGQRVRIREGKYTGPYVGAVGVIKMSDCAGGWWVRVPGYASDVGATSDCLEPIPDEEPGEGPCAHCGGAWAAYDLVLEPTTRTWFCRFATECEKRAKRSRAGVATEEPDEQAKAMGARLKTRLDMKDDEPQWSASPVVDGPERIFRGGEWLERLDCRDCGKPIGVCSGAGATDAEKAKICQCGPSRSGTIPAAQRIFHEELEKLGFVVTTAGVFDPGTETERGAVVGYYLETAPGEPNAKGNIADAAANTRVRLGLPATARPAEPVKASPADRDEAWYHAACLSIAEGAPGWSRPLGGPHGDSLATKAVRNLRAEVERLRVGAGLDEPTLARRLFETDPRVVKLVLERSETYDGHSPGSVEDQESETRYDRAMDVAWERDELGVRTAAGALARNVFGR